jgi:hypothetical protein
MGVLNDKNLLIKALKGVRRNVCCYSSENFCDCKYGLDDKEMIEFGSETTGCPELRTVIYFLEKITEEEFKEILNRKEQVLNYDI